MVVVVRWTPTKQDVRLAARTARMPASVADLPRRAIEDPAAVRAPLARRTTVA